MANQTPSTGPAMNDSSTNTESRARAVRLSASGTATITACRTIENDGTTNSPAKAPRISSTQYPANGATDQQAAVMITDGATTRRRPNRSSSRPRHGPLIAAATVAAAVTRPAAP